MIIVVIVMSVRIWFTALRRREPLPTSEIPAEPSMIWAPAGLFPTPEERAQMGRVRGAPAPAGLGRAR
jgi:carbon starvation protein